MSETGIRYFGFYASSNQVTRTRHRLSDCNQLYETGILHLELVEPSNLRKGIRHLSCSELSNHRDLYPVSGIPKLDNF